MLDGGQFLTHPAWHSRNITFGQSASTPKCLFYRETGLHRDPYRCATNILRSVVAARSRRQLLKRMERSGISDAEYSVERIYLHKPSEKNVSVGLAFGAVDREDSFRTMFQQPHRKDHRCTTLLERPDPYLAAHSLAFSVRLSHSIHDLHAVYSDLEEVDLTTREVTRKVCLVGPEPLPVLLSVPSGARSQLNIPVATVDQTEDVRSSATQESARSSQTSSTASSFNEEAGHSLRDRYWRDPAVTEAASDGNLSPGSSPESAIFSTSPSRLPSIDSTGSSASFSSDIFSDSEQVVSSGSELRGHSETSTAFPEAGQERLRRSRRRTQRPEDIQRRPASSESAVQQQRDLEPAPRAHRQVQPQRNRTPVIKYIHHDLERNELLLTSIQTQEVICAVIVFQMWPLKFLLHFQVLRCDFPHMDSVSVGEGVVMLSSRTRNIVSLYSLDAVMQSRAFEIDVGEVLTVNGSSYVIGQSPHGLPINGRLTSDATPIATFPSRQGYMELGGTPYYTVTKEKGRPGYEVRSVSTDKFVLASDCLPSVDLSPDAATFLDDGPFLIQHSVSELRVYDLRYQDMPLSISAESFSDARATQSCTPVVTRSGRRCRQAVPVPTDSDWRLTWNVEDELDVLVVLIVEEAMEKEVILRRLLLYDRMTWKLTSDTHLEERIPLHGSGLSEVGIVLDRCLLFVKIRTMAGKCTALVYHVTPGGTEPAGHVT